VPQSFLDWVAYLGLVVPLCVLAWSGATYALALRNRNAHSRFERFFQVMDHLGQQGSSIASKMAAAYELRKYPEYKDVVIRLSEQVIVDGPSAKMLADELRLTADYMKNL
jgi:hypothetical protein